MSQETELIFVPLMMISHLVPAIRVANLLTQRNKTLKITFLMMKLPMNGHVSSFVKSSSCNNSRISFVQLEPGEATFQELMKDPSNAVKRLMKIQTALIRAHVAAKLEATAARKKPITKIGGLVIDMMCADMVDVADELNIPTYALFSCCASGLGLWLHLQAFADDGKKKNLKEYEDDSGSFELSVPTHVNPIPAKVWPDLVFEEDGSFLDMARKFRRAKGIVVNTFFELESRAIKALSDDARIPAVYPVGPILHVEREESCAKNEEKHKEIVSWLDDQPSSSVVYICFGSAGCFEPSQLKEIATALERSGHRFLWSVRKPPSKEVIDFLGEYENPGEVLPLGFLESTKGIGKIISWAPQMAVLSHRAVGGFVTHCGWNSILESIWCGVPMAAWPLFAEQQLNAFQLVREFGVAVEVKMDYRKGSDVVVGSDKIEKAVRELMENNEIRVKLKGLKEMSRTTMLEGGSSYEFLGKWIDEVVNSTI